MLIALTSRSAKSASIRPEIAIGDEPTRVLVEQLGAVDIDRLGEPAGRLSPEEQWGVHAALLTVPGLN